MNVLNRKIVTKYTKNNKLLEKEYNKFIKTIKQAKWKTSKDVKDTFSDADAITKDIYIFNIKSNRSLCIIYFDFEDVEFVWVGTHDNYTKTFKNNKSTIIKYFKNKGYEL